jgi:hypothetical protein
MGQHRRSRTPKNGRYTPPKPRDGDLFLIEGVTFNDRPVGWVVAVWCDDPDCTDGHGG